MKKKIKLFYRYSFLAIKIILFSWLLLPVFLVFTAISNIKARAFLKKDRILNYLNNHKGEIKGLGNHEIFNLKIEKIRKGVSNLVYKQSFSFDGNRKITLVGKKFLPFGSIITFISSYLGPWPKGIPMSTENRFKQEINALTFLKQDSVYTPEILFVDHKEKLILMEYIPGVDSRDFLEQATSLGKIDRYLINFFYSCGRSLALLHRGGISLISHNDRSRILKRPDERVYFIDFELSTANDYKAWDLAIFMHWIRVKLGFGDISDIKNIETAFFNGYKELGSVNKRAIDRHLEDLSIYAPFAKVCMWINRRRKSKAAKVVGQPA